MFSFWGTCTEGCNFYLNTKKGGNRYTLATLATSKEILAKMSVCFSAAGHNVKID